MQKERKATNWHQRDSKQASAPLILDPTAGSLTRDARDVCAKFEQVSGMRVSVVERAGQAIKHLAKSEPLKRKGCGRLDVRNASHVGLVEEIVRRMELHTE